MRSATDLGENYPQAPTNLTLENNLIADSHDVRQVRAPAGGSMTSNTVGTKAAVGLAPTGETWKLAAGSTQIDKAVGTFDFVTTDFENNRRAGRKDIGADERSP